MNDERPTKEQNEALPYEQVYELSKVAWNNAAAESECDFREGFFAGYKAATASDPGPPRPDDMAALARLVAKELRKRGSWAQPCDHSAPFGASVGLPRPPKENQMPRRFWWSLHNPCFDKLTPREIADMIQVEEAKKAAEWAGDE